MSRRSLLTIVVMLLLGLAGTTSNALRLSSMEQLTAVDVSTTPGGGLPATVTTHIRNVSGYTLLQTSNSSALYQMTLEEKVGQPLPFPYVHQPYFLTLKGGRKQIGYDYANLLAEQTQSVYESFIGSELGTNMTKWESLETFVDYLWNTFYVMTVPQRFLDEFSGMRQWSAENPTRAAKLRFQPDLVSRRFFVLANMPADEPNLIAALEYEYEGGLPKWLRKDINEIIAVLLHFKHGCDSYGVWGSRTWNGKLYTSRNLDYNKDTGINKYKLVANYEIIDVSDDAMMTSLPVKKYATIGFAFGPGALAGISSRGITTSEMNLDNSRTTFSGVPFPLRLRYVLEEAHDLESAMRVWNATNNTDSMNYMIGSAVDNRAFALETMRNFTAQFTDASGIEAAATYDCGEPPHVDHTCRGWTPNMMTNKTTGLVPIGFPLKEAVWRSNHGLNPYIMKTQEPLFNNTIYRYNLMHKLFSQFEENSIPIDDEAAVGIVATLGTKGPDFHTCDQDFRRGDNIMSIAYVPGEQRFYAAWELGSGPSNWRPAACAPFVHLNMSLWW